MIYIKTKEEIEILKKGGKILSDVLNRIIKEVRPGISTEYLENLACNLIEKAGGRPAFKNYEIFSGEYFPTALCTSINDEVVHSPAIPGRILKEGDIVGLDLGMEYPVSPKKSEIKNKHSKQGGFYTDMAKTIAVGKISPKVKKLLEITEKSLELGIKKAKPGNTLKDIGREIQKYVERHGFSVVRDLVGHGVGYLTHEDPQIFNYEFSSNEMDDEIIKTGMVIAIEPMVNTGTFKIKGGDNVFSIITADGGLSAHFEHTVAITEKGNVVITK